jgi:hypothetical protein
LTNGSVVAWGGGNAFRTLNVPSSIQGKVIKIAASQKFAMALLDDGTIATWGDASTITWPLIKVAPPPSPGYIDMAGGLDFGIAIASTIKLL